ncbi:outer dense fiber protein 3-like protein 2 [Trichosurus vulpecula]|uniref:outer dense fiber protein 3-like protein 2 n=1 Tax=Trichosurus vulpecula TaxID=9337 RepID=UPI00186AC419|nr:outer dense fiber protein 3-like protein 2 [Trichosurus vulpecula]
MGTLSCGPPPPRLPGALLARRGTVCQLSETGQKKTSGITTCETGPGPDLFCLPSTVGYISHDFTKKASPAYSFLSRPIDVTRRDSSPGPCYFVQPNITRFGRSSAPAYSLQSRTKPKDLEVTPGPGAYSPEKVPPINQPRSPAYSLGLRIPRCRLVDSVPAPNSYTLPSLWGSQIFTKPCSPSYSVSGRTAQARFTEDPSQLPGPGQYECPDPDTYRQRRGPAYSMLGRPCAPRPLFQTPGPGAHNPEQVTVHWTRAPAYSLGIRHSKFVTPLLTDNTA